MTKKKSAETDSVKKTTKTTSAKATKTDTVKSVKVKQPKKTKKVADIREVEFTPDIPVMPKPIIQEQTKEEVKVVNKEKKIILIETDCGVVTKLVNA